MRRLSTKKKKNIYISNTSPHWHIPIMYWLLKSHKQPFKFALYQPLRKVPPNIDYSPSHHLITIKVLFILFCNKTYNHRGVNHLKKFVEALDNLHSLCCKFNSFDSMTFILWYHPTISPHLMKINTWSVQILFFAYWQFRVVKPKPFYVKIVEIYKSLVAIGKHVIHLDF